jgi:hypothetical protein
VFGLSLALRPVLLLLHEMNQPSKVRGTLKSLQAFRHLARPNKTHFRYGCNGLGPGFAGEKAYKIILNS